jgi:ribosomal protein S18 acetylase RimI-like enzyme
MVRRVISLPPAPEGLRFRAATKGDLSFIRDLSVEVFNQFGDYGNFLPGYLSHPSVFTTVAEERGLAIGFTMLALVVSELPLPGPPTPPTHEEGGPRWLDAELIAIAVSPGQQARGIGRQLMEQALEFSRSWQATAGVRSVQLNVADTNTHAFDFFTRLGFEILDSNDGTYPKGQRSVRMFRPLPPG